MLGGLLSKRSASLVVIYGRKRIGKSRLVEEFGRKRKMYAFSGLAPQSHMTMQSQLDEFSRQMARQLDIQNPFFSDWGDAFNQLAHHSRKGQDMIFFDEVSWLGSCNPDFLGKLKRELFQN